jgi:DNA polymerase III subunit epsilon
MKNLDLAIVDVETTGSRPTRDRLIEIGILRVEQGKLVQSFSSLINPRQNIPPDIGAVTGVRLQELSKAPPFRDIKDQILELLKGCTFVAHHVRFHYGFIKNEFKRVGISYGTKCLCTARLSRILFPNQGRHDLDDIVERFGFEATQRHGPLDDARVLWRFIQAVQSRFPRTLLERALEILRTGSSFPPQVGASTVNLLPKGTGVYLFHGPDDSTLYVGKSVNVRKRVLAHFSQDHTCAKGIEMCQQVADIKAIQTSGEITALLLESRLIKQLQPIYNRRSRICKRLVVLKELENGHGYHTVRVEHLKAISPIELPRILAIFRSLRQAKNFLWAAVKDLALCPKILGLEKGRGSCFYSQLHHCGGACVGAEAAAAYNVRFAEVFATQRIKPWPFSGPILFQERNANDAEGEVFLIDQWCFVNSSRFDDYGQLRLFDAEYVFDYDSYKILSRYLLTPKGAIRLKTITSSEMRYILDHFSEGSGRINPKVFNYLP